MPPAKPDNYHWVLLELNGIQLMLESIYEEDAQPAERRPVEPKKDMVLYFGCPDIEAAHARLEENGVAAEGPVCTGYSFKALYFRDPDGFLVVFHWPLEDN